MTNRKTLLVMLVLTFFAPTLHAQDPRADVRDVMAEIMLTDGVLTEDMHRRYWDAQRALAPPGQELEGATLALENLLIAEKYQHAMWQSVRVSYNRQRPVKSHQVIELRASLLSHFEKTLPWPEGSPDYIGAMSGYRAGLANSDENLDLLLNAAAARESLLLESGETFELTPETIDAVIAGHEATFKRLERLFDPVWTDDIDQEQEE